MLEFYINVNERCFYGYKICWVGVFIIIFFDLYFIVYISIMLNIWLLLRCMKFCFDLNLYYVIKNLIKICNKIDIEKRDKSELIE